MASVCFSKMAELKVKRIHTNATLPTRAEGDAGYDLYSSMYKIVPARGRAIIGTGIAIQLPSKYVYGSMRSRSGLSAKHGLEVGAGVIDSSYRGEIKVILYNHSDTPYVVNEKDKIAQLIVQVCADMDVMEVEELNETERGENGFGSSGYQ